MKSKDFFFFPGRYREFRFYLQKGRAKVTVVSKAGKETITFLDSGDFVGEDVMAAIPGLRLSSGSEITAGTALKIDRDEMVRGMHADHAFRPVHEVPAGPKHANSS